MKPFTHLAEMLDSAAGSGKGIVFIHKKSESRLTYRQLYEEGLALAARLLDLGWQAREEVVIRIDDPRAFVTAFWGCLLGGWIPVPVTAGGSDENRAKLLQVWGTLNRPRLLADPAGLADAEETIGADRLNGSSYCLELERSPLDSAVGRRKELPYRAAGDDLAFLQFSSGSTGEPKGVMLTHGNLLSNMNAIVSNSGTTADDSSLSWMPLTHDMGLIGFHLAPIYAGMEQYLMQPAQFMLDPMLWLSKANEHRITSIASPNFGYKHFLGCYKPKDAEGWDLSCIRLIFNGAEPISAEWADKFVAALAPSGLRAEAMFPVYGMAEATLAVTFPPVGEPLVPVRVDPRTLLVGEKAWLAEQGDAGAIEFVDVGYPVEDCEVSIRDEADGELADGLTGHILIRGLNVTKGYYNAPQQTLKAFASEGWLRTGDLGFMRGGRLVITGRYKDIIFVRGQNVYPHDLEKRVESIEGIGYGKAAACGAPNRESGEEEIVIFVQHRGKLEKFAQLADKVQRQLSRETGFDIGLVLPIRNIPRTTSGKIQRYKLSERLRSGEWDETLRELAQLIRANSDVETAVEQPEDDTPEMAKLKQIWREALDVAEVRSDDHFLERGGNSLKAARLLANIRQQWGIELSIRELFDYATPRVLLEKIRLSAGTAEATSAPALPELPEFDEAAIARYPASVAQTRMAFVDQTEDIGCAYHIPVALSIEGPLRPDAVQTAIEQLIRRHATLRTSYHWEEDELVQKVSSGESVRFELSVFPVRTELLADAVSFANAEAKAMLAPFDLGQPLPLRAGMWTDGVNRHLLLLNVHHIASDGIGMNVLMREFSALLNGEALPILGKPYAAFSEWERQNRNAKPDSEAYWRKELELPSPPIDWPDVAVRPDKRSFRGSTVRLELPPELMRKWQKKLQQGKGTVASLLLTLHAAIVSRFSGYRDFSVGILLAGRTNPETLNMVGMFNNYVPVRVAVDGILDFHELWRRTGDKLWDALSHSDVPYEKLIEMSGRGVDRSRNPLFDTMLVYHNQSQEARARFEAAGCRFEQVNLETGTAKLDLKLDVYPEPAGSLSCVWEYNDQLIRRETVERMASHFLRLAEQAANEPERVLNDICLLTEDERRQVVETFNATETPFPAELTLPELFRRQAEKTPERVAAVFGAERLTYRELETRANRVAHRLLAHGLRSGEPVGLMTERSPAMMAGLLGILKAGGAYVPLPPDFPADRLRYMADNAGLRLVCAQANWLGFAAEACSDAALIDLDLDGEGSAEAPDVAVSPEQNAYILYTSGSTGRPKGVMIRNRSVINRIHWMQQAYSLGERDVILQKTPYSFDVSVWELFWWMLSGSSVAFLAPGAEKDPGQLLKAIEANRITTMHFVPSMLAAFLEAAQGEKPERLREKLGTLRHVFASGEALHKAHVEKFYALMRQAGLTETKLVNLYGPTEATVDVTAYVCEPDSELDYVPIGKPIDNTAIYIVGESDQAQPIGVPGELCIAGVQLAAGYANQPELTADKFVANPFVPGTRMYRTGDLARWTTDGQIQYLGRIDDQVKIRGYRIELGEIERTLLAHDAVSEAAVVAADDGMGGKRLVAYIVADRACTSGELRKHCGERLPDYMIPALFAQLERMPLTASGKADRKALPAPEAEMDTGVAYAEPTTATEQRLAALWEELLQRDKVGIDDDFFAIGGHSLKAATLAARVHKEFHLQLSMRDIFRYPTLRTMSQRMEQSVASGGDVKHERIPAIAPRARYPLSSAQNRLFVLQAMDAQSTAYHLPTAIRIAGPLDRAKLLLAVRTLSERHETLRTSFEWLDGTPMQRISSEPIAEIEYEVERDADPDACLREFVKPFDLGESPLFRVKLIRRSAQDHLLLMDMHHLIADGVSTAVLAEQFVRLYEGERLEDLPIQYKDYAAWQTNWLSTDESLVQERYWLERLSGAVPTLDLPTDYARPARLDYEGDSVTVFLGAERTRELKELGLRTGTTLYMALLGLFSTLLHRYSRQAEIWIGSPVAGRPHADLADLVGMFVNTVVLRNRIDGSRTFFELLEDVKGSVLGALDHDRYPFEELVDKLGVRRDTSRNPLFDAMFVLQNTGAGEVGSSGTRFEPLDHRRTTAKFDLTLEVVEKNDELVCRFEYRTSLFRRETVERMARHFLRLAEQAASYPDSALNDISLMTKEERRQVVETFNATETPFPDEMTLPELFRRQAEKSPDRVAAVFGKTERLTYRELETRANSVAHRLLAHGLRSGEPVGLMTERSPAMMAGLLGILKAGGAYVPLPPDFPADRLRYMADNAGIRQVCAQASWLDAAAEVCPGAELLDLDECLKPAGSTVTGESLAAEPSEAPYIAVSPEQNAYILYTSGSTGRPKGVMIRHRSVINRIHWMQKAYSLGERDVILQKTPYSFDVSVWELFWWMLSGSSVAFLAPGAEKDPGQLLEAIEANRITTMHFVPSMLAAFLEAAQGEKPERLREKLGTLRHVFASGEALHKAHVEKFYALMRQAGLTETKLVNLYGPTEATVDVTAYVCEPDSELDYVPIGKPIDNTAIYIVGESDQAQPIGVPGELCIAGVQLAAGYANQPELTADKFVANPFVPGTRMYRTGDLARWTADGQIQYLGRIDDQVKIRGYRIELGEIERTLLAHDAVSEAAVVAADDGMGGKRLVAYIVADRACTSGELRKHCGERLPDYMIPALFAQLERMPLTASGKADRKALPAPEAEMDTGVAYAEPTTATEQRLAALWEELLQRDKVGIDDNFFELGGNSLLLLRMHKELETSYPGMLTVADLFAYPTVSKLAVRLSEEGSAMTNLTVVPIRVPEQARPLDRHARQGDLLRLPLNSQTVRQLERIGELEGVDPELAAIAIWAVMFAQAFRQPRYDLLLCGLSDGAGIASVDLNAVKGYPELLRSIRETRLQPAPPYPVLVKPEGKDSPTAILPLYRGSYSAAAPEQWLTAADLTVGLSGTGTEKTLQAEYDAGKISKDKVKELLQSFPIWCRRMAVEGQAKEQTAAAGVQERSERE
ncbi:non-ribosomal peptide synthetase [Cohnella cholangitidis]|uniref:Amino acid adenylation domain-containing protein n=1 Tax=Cohnella cholangitidis TaxID=2598458 RepID=A0A7G5BS82_9BACL|nr:non-ribosomal peptide synthetase [Cohnella cholangitidis]QMV39816.1 amino acid adenylation domain-containing protein [Cohnella cholangitidis]